MKTFKLAPLPDVVEASCEELIAAGWGEVERHHIPAHWRAGRVKGEPLREIQGRKHITLEQVYEQLQAMPRHPTYEDHAAKMRARNATTRPGRAASR